MPALPSTVYDPRRIIVTFGPLPVVGLATGRFLTARRDVGTWSTVDGTNGERKRIRSRNTSGTVEVTLRGTAPVNRALGILTKVDERSGQVFAPLAVTDTLNGALFFSKSAYIERAPDMVYSSTEGDITWKFICDDLKMNYPGLSLETVALRIGSLG